MKTIFHIGYPKAASSFLQKDIFGRHPNILNLGLYPTQNIGVEVSSRDVSGDIPYLADLRIKELYTNIMQPGGLQFDLTSTKRLWERISDDYCTLHKNEDKTALILSHEAATSARFSNPEITEKARRIRDVFGPIGILILVRRQQDMLISLYRDHPFDPRTLELAANPIDFRNWLEIDLKRASLSLAETLYFDRTTRFYETLFGKENVLVLPIELLKSNRELFSEYFSEFIGIEACITTNLLDAPPVNTGVSVSGNAYRTLKSKLRPMTNGLGPIKRYLQRIDKPLFEALKRTGKPHTIKVCEAHERLLRDIYRKDNMLLAERRGLPLKELGYYI